MIIERLPSPVLSLLGEVEALGFSLTLVGGSPRDLLFADLVETDLDFEIRPKTSVSIEDWPAFYKKLPDFLSSKGLNPRVLPYLITRIEVGEFSLEFSSPRLEINVPGNYSHHHFEAILDPQLSFKDSFKRRDLTINAIGFKFDMDSKNDELIDPYSGASDLKNGILRPISDDFYNDSVRFLRLIRFQLKFNRFVMDPDLSSNLTKFNLSQLSQHYFKEELTKSDAGKFLNLFCDLVSKHQLQLANEFRVWTRYSYPDGLNSKEEILGFVFLQSREDAASVSEFFRMPAKVMKDLSSFGQSLNTLLTVSETEFETLADKSASEILSHPLMKECRNIEEKKIWLKHLHVNESSFVFGPHDWKGITASAEEIAALAPALRSYYPYYKALIKKFKR